MDINRPINVVTSFSVHSDRIGALPGSPRRVKNADRIIGNTGNVAVDRLVDQLFARPGFHPTASMLDKWHYVNTYSSMRAIHKAFESPRAEVRVDCGVGIEVVGKYAFFPGCHEDELRLLLSVDDCEFSGSHPVQDAYAVFVRGVPVHGDWTKLEPVDLATRRSHIADALDQVCGAAPPMHTLRPSADRWIA